MPRATKVKKTMFFSPTGISMADAEMPSAIAEFVRGEAEEMFVSNHLALELTATMAAEGRIDASTLRVSVGDYEYRIDDDGRFVPLRKAPPFYSVAPSPELNAALKRYQARSL